MTRYRGMFRLFPIPGASEDGFIITDRDIIKASIISLVKTHKGSRVYDPAYGTNIHKLLFEPNIQRTRNVAKAEIEHVISKYEPRAKLIAVNAYAGEPPHQDDAIVTVEIEYTEFSDRETIEIRFKKDQEWISQEGKVLDPVEEWFKQTNKRK